VDGGTKGGSLSGKIRYLWMGSIMSMSGATPLTGVLSRLSDDGTEGRGLSGEIRYCGWD